MLSESEQIIMVNLSDLVPNNHILRRLKDMFPWKEIAEPFARSFKGWKEYGHKGYPVSVLLKMCVLSHLYTLSNDTEIFVKENLSPPGHSSPPTGTFRPYGIFGLPGTSGIFVPTGVFSSTRSSSSLRGHTVCDPLPEIC